MCVQPCCCLSHSKHRKLHQPLSNVIAHFVGSHKEVDEVVAEEFFAVELCRGGGRLQGTVEPFPLVLRMFAHVHVWNELDYQFDIFPQHHSHGNGLGENS